MQHERDIKGINFPNLRYKGFTYSGIPSGSHQKLTSSGFRKFPKVIALNIPLRYSSMLICNKT